MKYIFSLIFLLLSSIKAFAQPASGANDLVQFSGMVLAEEGGQLVPVPFATVGVKGTARGTYANYKGFFSLVVKRGETIRFTAVGFADFEKVIPDSLKSSKYAVVQLMSATDLNLPELVVFPWPNRDHFKQEFLAMNVTNALAENAAANLAKDRIAGVRNATVMDGTENGKYYLQQVAQKNSYIGGVPPMQIFNVASWAQFFTAWQRGDFKKKKKR